MVMMLADMPVLVLDDTVVKPVFMCKTIPAQETQGVRNKGGCQVIILFIYEFK